MDGDVVSSLHLVVLDDIISSISKLQTKKEIWDILTKLYEAFRCQNLL